MKPLVLASMPVVATAQHVQSGLPIPKAIRVKNFHPDEWEAFIEEWGHSLEGEIYPIVRRFGGSGDMGVDVAGFAGPERFNGNWDNFQCKRYDHALQPSDIYVEVGKVIYYSWKGEYTVPRNHFFAGSQGIGTKLEKLLGDPEGFRQAVRDKWDGHCKTGITITAEIPLTGDLLKYFDAFDFKIFGSKSVLDLISQHEKSPHHSIRFGGGLPPRPAHDSPPSEPTSAESRYIRQLLDAYGDHASLTFPDVDSLAGEASYIRDLERQRERFYYAEALRNFSRDTVPEGTFAALQDEVFHSVIELCECDHPSGLDRMRAAVNQAGNLPIAANPLSTAVKTQDKQGICHQLANDDRVQWVPSK